MSNNSISIYKFKPFEFTVLKKNLDPQQCPLVRLGHRVVCNTAYLLSIGGFHSDKNDDPGQGETSAMQEIWKYYFDVGEWKSIKCQNIPHELASSPVSLCGNIIITHGGTDVPSGDFCSNRMYIGNLANAYKESGMKFKEIIGSGDVPLPLYGQGVVMDGKYIYSIGGTTGSGYEMDVHRFDLRSNKWELLHKSLGEDEDPEPRYLHDVVFYKGSIYIFGGMAEDEENIVIEYGFSGIDMFDVANKQWHLLPTKPDHKEPEPGYPINRCWHSCVQCPEKSNLVYLCGGLGDFQTFNDVWRIDIDTMQWEKLTNCIMPLPVYLHSTAVTPSGRMCCYGGIVTERSDLDAANRSNDITSAWITIPKLKVICWEAMIHYFKEQMFKSSDEGLKKIGIPQEFYERIIEARRIC